MPIAQLTPLPDAPSRNDAPENFTAKADASLAAQKRMVNEFNQAIGGINEFSDTATSTKGAALIGFLASTKALGQSVADKLRETVSARDFGGIGDGTVHTVQEWIIPGVRGWAASLQEIQAKYPHVTALTDTIDWAAIQAAINYVGSYGGVYLPGGSWMVNKAIDNTASGVRLFGANRWTTRIVQSSPAARIINNSGMFFSLENLSLDYSATPTAEMAIYSSGSYSEFTSFTVRKAFVGAYITSGVAQRLSNFDILDYESAGLHLRNTNDAFVSAFIINAGDPSRGDLGGIRLEDKVEALVCHTGDVLGGGYSLTSIAASNTRGARPAYNRFCNVYFDSASNSAVFDSMVETDFIGCWFSNGRVANAAKPSAAIANCHSIRFTNTQFFNSGSHGCTVGNTAKKISFVNCSFESNSLTTGDGVSHGLLINDNTTNFSVIGGKAGNGLYTGKQGYGISIGAGCSDFSIRDVDLRDNATGAINDLSTSSNKVISGCLGYVTQAKGTVNVIVGQTVTTVTHGLARAPAAADISISFAASPAPRGVTSIYVTSITATTFQIATNAAVTTSDLAIAWQARISGA